MKKLAALLLSALMLLTLATGCGGNGCIKSVSPFFQHIHPGLRRQMVGCGAHSPSGIGHIPAGRIGIKRGSLHIVSPFKRNLLILYHEANAKWYIGQVFGCPACGTRKRPQKSV